MHGVQSYIVFRRQHVYQHRSGKSKCYNHNCWRYRMRRQKARHVLHQQPPETSVGGGAQLRRNITSEESKFYHCCISKDARPIAWKDKHNFGGWLKISSVFGFHDNFRPLIRQDYVIIVLWFITSVDYPKSARRSLDPIRGKRHG